MPFLSFRPSNQPSYVYSLLPTSTSPDRAGSSSKLRSCAAGAFLTRRYARICIAIIATLTLSLFFSPLDSLWSPSLSALPYPPYPTPLDQPPGEDTRPPLYERYFEYERHLPQHRASLQFPDGKHAKFIFIANHAWGAGWGNAMQELILNAHAAYASGRTFVFDNYTWNREGDYSDFNGKLIPSRVPLSALVAGPLVGDPYSNPGDAQVHPRFVSWQYYQKVCPHPLVLHSNVIRDTLPDGFTALQLLEAWVEKLQSIGDRCVEMDKDSGSLFDFMLLGSPRLHDILPSLFASPIVQEFSWSPLVHYAFQQNQHHFITTIQESSSTSESGDDVEQQSRYTLTPTPLHPPALPVLALHLRRGDFMEHCNHLYRWHSTYTGYNTLPGLPDRFFAEDPAVLGSMSEEDVHKGYVGKCFVDIDQVRKRVVRAVREWREKQLASEGHSQGGDVEARLKEKLKKVYIMTNGDREWLKELKEALKGDAERSHVKDHQGGTEYDYDFIWSWDEISSSRDLFLGWEARYVAQAIDMYVGQRAEVFVGNGFSSLTANIVMLRAANGVEPWKTRFW